MWYNNATKICLFFEHFKFLFLLYTDAFKFFSKVTTLWVSWLLSKFLIQNANHGWKCLIFVCNVFDIAQGNSGIAVGYREFAFHRYGTWIPQLTQIWEGNSRTIIYVSVINYFIDYVQRLFQTQSRRGKLILVYGRD